MAASRRVGVREFVDERDLRVARDERVEVHLLKRLPLIFDALLRDDFEALEQRLGFLAAMGLSDADDDVVSIVLSGAGRLEHLVGLADTGCGANEDPELPDAGLLASRFFKQGFRRR